MEREKTTVFNGTPNRHKGTWFGLLVIACGIVLLGFNFGYIPREFRSIFISWQMLLIVIGLFQLCVSHFTSGLIITLIGGFFMLPKLAYLYPAAFNWVNPNFTQLFWPLLLIIIGIVIISNRSIGRRKSATRHYASSHANIGGKKEEYSSGGYFERNVIFGGTEMVVLDQYFYGCDLNSVFGGIELDLRKTNLPEGVTRMEVNAVFGGITVIVPEDWFVEAHVGGIFGGFQDNRVRKEHDSSRKLIIKGDCVFGGGELKN